jgi:excisionase family DNA binding protein
LEERHAVVDEEYFTVDEVAERLRVSRATVYNWMRSKALPYVVVGDKRRITGSAIRAFVRPGDAEELTDDDRGNKEPARLAATNC